MFIGTNGYTIPKKDMNKVAESELRRTLTFKPQLKSYGGEAKSFIAFRESKNYYYVPKFYGLDKYGPAPTTNKPIKKINVSFSGTLRPVQHQAVDAFIKAKSGLLELPCGFGKTILALYIIHLLQLKTIVIVHKEFLVDQWTEKIKEFLPSATIGRLQGTIIDIDKDIVIGMLQSISMKDYPKEMFSGFGLTIIDETHHIAAEVFSNTLFKLVTPHTLGLSATMERKDGLSKVFKMFLGDIVFSAQREQTTVVVHKVLFTSENEEFNTVVKNFRGETNYTTMIKKISEFNPRKDCILNILEHILTWETTEQVMILSHTKALLQYLYDAIVHRSLATVGFYVGGMKAVALKETETKRIVLATFAMAEEALDIKTLTTLIMATPRTTVTQPVGRILRTNHDMPLVIDIVDSHGTFLNQWAKRRATTIVKNILL